MSQGFFRLTWVIIPLAVVSVLSAGEWPARAQMLEEPYRTPAYELASQWDVLIHGAKPVVAVSPVIAPTVVAAVQPVPAQVAQPKAPVQIAQAPKPAPISTATGGKVLLLGDSLMGGVAPGLRQELPRSFVISNHHRSSTGLTNQGYYDWAAEAGVFTAQEAPQWVFIHLGGNDGQDMMVAGRWVSFGSEQWRAQYLLRAKTMIVNIRAAAPNATIVWVGLPAMRPEKYETKTRVIAKVQEQAARESGVAYASGLDALGHSYGKQGPGVDGKQQVLRLDDGIHYSREGGRVLAHAARKMAAGLP
jgi:hypothetical protein